MKRLEKLPENWAVKITEENREMVIKWFDNDRYYFSIGSYYGFEYGIKFGHGSMGKLSQEITTEDFKRLVLGEEEEEKQYEYKLKDSKYVDAVEKLIGLPYFNICNLKEENDSVKVLKELNVLDIFFDKVEVVELPIIGEDRVEYRDPCFLVCGTHIDKQDFKRYKTFTLNNDVTVTEEHVKQIRKYLKE